MSRLVGAIGTPRILINNAAHDARHAFETLDVAAWDDRMAVNLRHCLFVAQALAPGMREAGEGVILNMGSTSWMKGSTNMIAMPPRNPPSKGSRGRFRASLARPASA